MSSSSSSSCEGECILLSASALADLLSEGWEIISGPHAMESACQANCCGGSSGSGVSNICCPTDLLPETLNVSFSGCVNGNITINFTDLGFDDGWEGTGFLDDCEAEIAITMYCEGEGVFALFFPADVNCDVHAAATTCNPLLIEFAPISGNCLSGTCPGCSSGTITVTVTG